jgi:hypothetical protein
MRLTAVPDLDAYRDAVADLLTEITGESGTARPGRAEMILAKRIAEPEVASTKIYETRPNGYVPDNSSRSP